MSPLSALLKATDQMRAMYPTDRDRENWTRERTPVVAATVVGAVASMLAFPSSAPVVFPVHEPPVIPEPPQVHHAAA